MKNMTLENIAKACGGEYIGSKGLKNKEITGVVKDNREVSKGCLFVPFVGNRVDGHDYIPDAFMRGALCVLSERVLTDAAGPYIKVSSTAQALKEIAEFYRMNLDVTIIGITGSVGKTSTKEVVASVLSQKFSVYKTEGNYNNEIGVPLTILNIRDEHKIAVVEMGISDFGEMHRLSKIVRPDICIITNIGTCHLENLGNRDGVLRAKSEIYDFMNENGAVILNGDDDKLGTIKQVRGILPVFYGRGRLNKVRSKNIVSLGLCGTCMDIVEDNKDITVTIPSPGSHMVMNVLAATAVGRYFGMTLEEIRAGVELLKPVTGRNNIINTGYITIIDDCYNANPASMKAALEVLSFAEGSKVAILGGMNELGEDSEKYHKEVGEFAGTLDIDRIFGVGNLAGIIADSAAESAAMHGREMETGTYYRKGDLEKQLCRLIKKGDTVLVKASHSFEFESIVKCLLTLKLDNGKADR